LDGCWWTSSSLYVSMYHIFFKIKEWIRQINVWIECTIIINKICVNYWLSVNHKNF
jgi:hypothetical protein